MEALGGSLFLHPQHPLAGMEPWRGVLTGRGPPPARGTAQDIEWRSGTISGRQDARRVHMYLYLGPARPALRTRASHPPKVPFSRGVPEQCSTPSRRTCMAGSAPVSPNQPNGHLEHWKCKCSQWRCGVPWRRVGTQPTARVYITSLWAGCSSRQWNMNPTNGRSASLRPMCTSGDVYQWYSTSGSPRAAGARGLESRCVHPSRSSRQTEPRRLTRVS